MGAAPPHQPLPHQKLFFQNWKNKTLITAPSDPGICKNTHTPTTLHKPQTLICTVLNSVSRHAVAAFEQTRHLGAHGWLQCRLCASPYWLKYNPEVQHQGALPLIAEGRQSGPGELVSIVSYYGHRQSGLLRCSERWPRRGSVAAWRDRRRERVQPSSGCLRTTWASVNCFWRLGVGFEGTDHLQSLFAEGSSDQRGCSGFLHMVMIW